MTDSLTDKVKNFTYRLVGKLVSCFFVLLLFVGLYPQLFSQYAGESFVEKEIAGDTPASNKDRDREGSPGQDVAQGVTTLTISSPAKTSVQASAGASTDRGGWGGRTNLVRIKHFNCQTIDMYNGSQLPVHNNTKALLKLFVVMCPLCSFYLCFVLFLCQRNGDISFMCRISIEQSGFVCNTASTQCMSCTIMFSSTVCVVFRRSEQWKRHRWCQNARGKPTA